MSATMRGAMRFAGGRRRFLLALLALALGLGGPAAEAEDARAMIALHIQQGSAPDPPAAMEPAGGQVGARIYAHMWSVDPG